MSIIPNPDKAIIINENHRPTYLMNIDVKIYEIAKLNLTMYKKNYIPCQNGIYSRYEKMVKSQQSEEEKSYDHVNRCRKSIWHNPISIHNTNSQQTRNRGELPQVDKKEKSTENLYLTSYLMVIN